MILDLDIGNSRIKWRLSDYPDNSENVRQQSGVAVNHNGVAVNHSGVALNIVELLGATVERHPVTRVRAASVRGGSLMAELTATLAKDWQLSVQRAQVVRRCQGVTVEYEDLTRLGVDRWLAMLAAYREAEGPCIVVDCGTAMTIDLIGEQGLHLGGYIVPGLRLIPDSLTQNTAIVLQTGPDWGLAPGTSTEQAIYHGALQMLVALLENTVARKFLSQPGMTPPTVYLTGGDAAVLADFLDLRDVTLKQVEGLVFDGLALAVP